MERLGRQQDELPEGQPQPVGILWEGSQYTLDGLDYKTTRRSDGRQTIVYGVQGLSVKVRGFIRVTLVLHIDLEEPNSHPEFILREKSARNFEVTDAEFEL